MLLHSAIASIFTGDDARLRDGEIMHDSVNHPKHYNSHPSGVECITVTEHMNFNIGNAIKYLWRSDHKNGLEDLKKARGYIDREIQRQETATSSKAPSDAAA